MGLIKEDLLNLIQQTPSSEEINPSEIPSIDLYMDQITTFFDDKLKGLKRDEDEKILTKTMINNYAKAKLLLPVKGKKYSKQQILLLAIIYNLKQTLSISDLGLVLAPIIENLSEGSKDFPLEDLYKVFLELNSLQKEEFQSWFKEKIDLTEEKSLILQTHDKDLVLIILTVLMLIDSANRQKRMAEKILDNFFKKESKK